MPAHLSGEAKVAVPNVWDVQVVPVELDQTSKEIGIEA